MSDSCCSHGCAAPPASQSPRYRRVLWAALFINAAMFGIEIVGGLQASSVSLLADAVDFFGDAANYGISLLVLGMALLFCAYLKWQPWHARQHLSLFVMAAPLAGLFWTRYGRIAGTLTVLLLIMALPYLMARPIAGELALSRQQQYRARLPDAQVTEVCAGELDGNAPEYLLYVYCP